MTIDEAIAFCCEKSNNIKLKAEPQVFIQLAEWLKELKDYRDKNKMVVRVDVENMDCIKDKIEELSKYAENQYSKAIDDFLEKIQWEYLNGCGIKQSEIEFIIAVSSQVAEQLKAGGENGL